MTTTTNWGAVLLGSVVSGVVIAALYITVDILRRRGKG